MPAWGSDAFRARWRRRPLPAAPFFHRDPLGLTRDPPHGAVPGPAPPGGGPAPGTGSGLEPLHEEAAGDMDGPGPALANAARFGHLLDALRRRRPLVHHMTSMVVAHVTANVTLALGASPIMAAAAEEVEEVAAQADALVLNLGTLTPAAADTMVAAGRAANAAGRPVILDPVGYGFTGLRTRTAQRILSQVQVAVIRGNQAEIALLAGTGGRVRGVDAAGSLEDAAVEDAARRLAERTGAVAAVTGPVDRVAGPQGIIRIHHGHPLMAAVTGTGCMATTAVAAFTACAPDRPWEAAAAGLGAFALAGERAAGGPGGAGPGSFQAALLDALYRLEPGDLDSLRVEVVS